MLGEKGTAGGRSWHCWLVWEPCPLLSCPWGRQAAGLGSGVSPGRARSSAMRGGRCALWSPRNKCAVTDGFCVWPGTVWRGEWSTQPPEPVGCAAGAVPPGGSTGRRPGGSGSAGLCGQSALGGAHCANSAGTLRLIQLSKTRVSFLFNCFSS